MVNLATTYTYALSHDIWNCSYNLLIGASFILLTNTDNRIYVCRTGLPRNPVEVFMAEGAKLIEEHNKALIGYKVSFDRITLPQIENYIGKLKEVDEFTTSVLSNITTLREEQQRIEINLNKLLRELFSFSVPISFMYSQFQPNKELTMPSEINHQTVGEIMNTIISQKIIQTDTATLFERLKASMNSVNFALINQINFFSSDTLITDMRENERYMKPLLGSLSLIARIKINLPIFQKTLEILKNISSSNYIRKKYVSDNTKPGFDYLFRIFLSVYDDLLNKTAKPSRKRERDGQDTSPEHISFARLNELLTVNSLLIFEKFILSNPRIMGTVGTVGSVGGRRRKFQRGGSKDDNSFLTGEFLLQRQINRLLVPVASDILEGNGQESASERQMLIQYILIGIAKFLSYQPPYENADHISKWGPIFVEMIKPILEDGDETTQRIKLKFFLGIWLTENPIKNMNITMDIPILYWTDMVKEAGHVLIDFIFGNDVYTLFGIQEPEKIKYNLEIKTYKASYESAYETVVKFLQKDATSPDSAPILTGAISQPVLITGVGLNVFKKGLSTPSPAQVLGVSDTTTPTLLPGILGSSSAKDPTSGGANKTRKIKRKRFKYKRCPTKRHFKL